MLGLKKLGKSLFGSANDRTLAKMQPLVDAINGKEAEYEKLDDDGLKAKTIEFRERHENGESLDDLLVEAFAVVREAAKRVLGLRHYDVQLIGGIVLHRNAIAEMKTGEGKTLVATLATYLNAIPGKGVHVVTVNDYLASRDAQWMGRIYDFLGMTTGTIVPGLSAEDRREAYAADITYATNNELGFDYLRDNMAFHRSEMVQRGQAFAIVDEVDSILIDEARTPLIVSGPIEDKTDMYITIDKVMSDLSEEFYDKDEKSRAVSLTEDGIEAVEEKLRAAGLMEHGDLYDYENTQLLHHVEQALRARVMQEKDTDYIVKNGKVVIIDEFTGRMMEGRRWSGGLHQAVEAKEGVPIQPENQTLASVTFQNYFRQYDKLAGMTGTAATEAEEFGDIYGLNVVEIPTHVPVARVDEHDEFYRTADEKYNALITEIRQAQDNGQPVLVGTVSIDKSEFLSAVLKKSKIKHQVLNARYHEQEAAIVAQAGRYGAVTIATNMAGRGTDIQLGGNADMRITAETEGMTDEAEIANKAEKIKAEVAAEKAKVLEAGGLYVIATERHESRRIDNQLRGRSGRQGDPGRSKFFLSLQDDLMRIFGPEKLDSTLKRFGIEEGEAIVHPWINKAIERAQQKVEARNYDIRKNVVKFDDVMNDQRHVIYEQRRDIMDADDVSDTIDDMRAEAVAELVEKHMPPKTFVDQWAVDDLKEDVTRVFALEAPLDEWLEKDGIDQEEIRAKLDELTKDTIAKKAVKYGSDFWRHVEKSYLLGVIDQEWKDHLQNLDHFRQSVSLRSYGQRDPLNEYKTEAFSLFEQMLAHTRETVTQQLFNTELRVEPAQPDPFEAMTQPTDIIASHADPITGENTAPKSSRVGLAKGDIDPNDPSTWGKVSRNAPCPCGSGKKYKHCHGLLLAP